MKYDSRLYHPISYGGRAIGSAYKISSTDFIVGFISEIRERSKAELGWLEGSRIRNEAEADTLLSWINTGGAKSYNALLNIQSQHDNWQQMTYIPSNLGHRKGYIFYFICNGCEERVKYLYMLKSSSIFRCRECNNLRYPVRITDVEPESKRLDIRELEVRDDSKPQVYVKRSGVVRPKRM